MFPGKDGTTLESGLLCSRTHHRHYRNRPLVVGIEVALFKHPKPKFWDTALTQKELSICGSRISSFLLPFVLNRIAAIAFPLRTRALATCFDDLVEAEVPEKQRSQTS